LQWERAWRTALFGEFIPRFSENRFSENGMSTKMVAHVFFTEVRRRLFAK
jgi:nucleoside-specific outer membrane channel protein Tsx